MTANKKNTSKAAKSPAPATKAQKSASKSATKKPATSAPLAATTPAVIAAPAPAPVTTAIRVAPPVSIAVATPVAVVAPKPLVTTINARIDVGFGNSLYLRGEGAGLSWDKGRLMTCVGADQWQITLPESSRPVLFKFLINDLTWSLGADSVVAPGTTSTFTPEF